jgi:hypothetical protein
MWGAEVMRVKRTDDLYKKMTASPSVDTTRIPDLFSVKYVVSTLPITSPHYELVGVDIEGLGGEHDALIEKPTIKVYRNKRVLPRAFLVEDYVVKPDASDALSLVSQPDFNPLRQIVLEEDPVWDPNAPASPAKDDSSVVRIVEEHHNAIELLARVVKPSVLFLADTYSPGWNASVDEVRTKIYLANYNFRAILLPTGEHRVVFRYEPESFYYGVWITSGTLVLMLLVSLRSIRQQRLRESVRTYGH